MANKETLTPFELSDNLHHTWFFDLDGTIFKHNGIWEDGYDTVLPGVKELWATIPLDDCIVISTARKSCWKDASVKALMENGLWYTHLLFDIAHGERIIINDIKPEYNLKTAIAWNVERDKGFPQ